MRGVGKAAAPPDLAHMGQLGAAQQFARPRKAQFAQRARKGVALRRKGPVQGAQRHAHLLRQT